jgi:hypothetical protein
MTAGLTEDDRRRMREFAERSSWDRSHEMLCPGENSGSDAEDTRG